VLGLAFLHRLASPVVRDERELFRYVARLTALCTGVAVLVDVVNQAVVARSWSEALLSWLVTAVLAATIAGFASRIAGAAHLQLYRAKVEAEQASRIDILTGLLNRRAFFDLAEATPAATVALAIADVDRFKRINDTRGHLAGDDILAAMGEIMRRELAPLGPVGRIGGEEFAVMATGIPAAEVLRRIRSFRERIAALPIRIAGGAVQVTVSVGIAWRRPGTTFREFYADADEALYAAKNEGRNRIALAPSFRSALVETDDTDLMGWLADADAETVGRSVA